MNVDTFLPDITVLPLTLETFYDMIRRRHATFCSFAEIEERRGFVRPAVSFSTSQGQEMLRIMLFRVLEEIIESHTAHTTNHIQEELIDALNYFLSALMIDHEMFDHDTVALMFYEITLQYFDRRTNHSDDDYDLFTCMPPNQVDIYKLTKGICGDLAETFRNRAWMNQTQQTYFHGYDQVRLIFKLFMNTILPSFYDWQNFYTMYIAKDEVLQFRLSSKY